MKKLLFGLAALPFLAGAALAAEALNNTQMDRISAGALPQMNCPDCTTVTTTSMSTNGVTVTTTSSGSGGSGSGGSVVTRKGYSFMTIIVVDDHCGYAGCAVA